MKKNYKWREGAFFKNLTAGVFTLVMFIGLSGSVNAQACTITNIQAGIGAGTLSIFATPGNGLAALFDPTGSGGVGDPGCAAVNPYSYEITSVELAMADASLFGLPGEGLGTFEYTVSIVNSVEDTCNIMGAVLWTSAVLTEVMADEGFHAVSVPVGIDVTGKFFVKINAVSWDGAANRSPSAYLWDGEVRPACRQVVITDGGATETDHGNYFSAPADGWYNVEVVGVVEQSCDVAIICDDIDAYPVGALGPNAAWWTTWSGTEGGNEDALVTTAFANSAPNSFLIDTSGGGPSDVLLLLGNLTTGSYALDMNFYIPAGKTGYFNFQEDEVAGVGWNLDIFMNEDGLAPGVGSFIQDTNVFAYNEDAWNSIHTVIDLDADLMSFWVNGVLVFEGYVYDGALGGLDFWTIDDDNESYWDDVIFYATAPLSPCDFPAIICDNIDSYPIGALGPNAAHWTTWSGTEGGNEDALVTNAYANSGLNSFLIDTSGGGPSDVLLLLGNLTTGTYSLDLSFYIPAGKTGYYNYQEDEVAGVAWNLDIFMNEDGLAPGVGSFAQSDSNFAYNEDAWNDIHTVIDLDADLMSFWVNGDLVFEGFAYPGALGGLDFWTIDDDNESYWDDVVYATAAPLSDCGFPTYICDNLDSYTLGFLGPQAPWWSTWSGTFETDEDGLVVDDQANTAPNSMYIGDNLTQDVLLFLGNQTTGVYNVSFNVYIPAGKGGYYNIQEDEVAGVAWNLDVFFNEDGGAPGVVTFAQNDSSFAYPEDEWFAIEMVIDLDNDIMGFWLNGDLVFYMPYAGSLGALDIFSIDANNSMYMDDVIYMDGETITVSVQELTSLNSFNLYPNPNDGSFTIQSGELSGSFVIDMVDVTGRVVYSEQIEMSTNENKAINTNDLNTGVYILRMVDVTTDEVYTTRVSIR